MKQHLFRKFVLTYIFIGICAFLLITTAGPSMIQAFLSDMANRQILQLLLCLYLLFALMYLPSGLMLLFYYIRVHRPLQEITKGAAEYAGGNLSYRIPVESVDEMGYLANTLNYMSDKLNENGEFQRDFISNVSHDFRSPLTSIKGYATAMLDGTIPVESQERYLKIIESETDRLDKLTQSLLTLNDLDIKKRALTWKQFNINDMIRATTAVFEGSCQKHNIHLELKLSEADLSANADEEQIQQVLYNLLDNAIKFSPDNSCIVLETSRKANTIFVSVEDHGCGIPNDCLSKIWTRFYKTDSSRGKDRNGTGLGLSIVKEILRAHDQQIDVVSTEGVGTKFIFTLEKAR
jgi:signal transduction histidine kinase